MMKSLLPLVLLSALTTTAMAQDSDVSPASNFLILVETTKTGVIFTSEAGCAFGTLTFTLKPGQSQAVNQYGMTSVEEHKSPANDKLANFLFTVKRTKDGLSFTGHEGTAWIELSFTCPDDGCKQLIDGNGMTDGW